MYIHVHVKTNKNLLLLYMHWWFLKVDRVPNNFNGTPTKRPVTGRPVTKCPVTKRPFTRRPVTKRPDYKTS